MPFAIYECYCNCKCYGECYQEFSFEGCIDCTCHDKEYDDDPPWDAYGLTYSDLFGD